MTPALGVLMLDTRFPRLPGDIGNPATFAFPVRYRVVSGASPSRVVIEADRTLVGPFVAAAQALAADGCAAISTSCGFLALFQAELEAAVTVPVWTSSLLLVPELQAALPDGRRVGVVTADAASLSPAHLRAAGAAEDTPIEGLSPDSPFHATLIDNRPELDAGLAEAATVAAALRLAHRHPELGAIVLECTNMPPYVEAVRAATGLPVHDITTLIASRFPTLSR
jgi:Asp/Glu/hydantoin racemase